MSNINVGRLTATGSVKLPSYTTANLPPGEEGLTVYDSTEKSIKYYDGTQWIAAGSGGKKTSAITVSNPTGNSATDIPVKVKITTTASGSTGDFGDIKFYSDAAGTVPLSYWRETFVSGSYAEFWVLIPSIPASGATFYAQKSTSNTYTGTPSSVFLYYNSGDNVTGWTANRGTLTTAGTHMVYIGSGSSAAIPTGAWYNPGETTSWSDYVWEYDTRRDVPGPDDYPWSSIRVRSPSGSVSKWWFEGSNGASGNTWRPYSSGSDGAWISQNTTNSGIGRGISSNWERHLLIATNNVGKVFWSTNTFGTSASATTFGFGHWDYSSQTTSPQSFVQQQNYAFASTWTNQGTYGTIAFDNHSGSTPTMWFKNLVVRKTFNVSASNTTVSLSPTVNVGNFA